MTTNRVAINQSGKMQNKMSVGTFFSKIGDSDLAHFIVEYKNAVIFIFVTILLAAIGFSGWSVWKDSRNAEIRESVYKFGFDKLTQVQNKTLSLEAFTKELDQKITEVKFPSAFIYLTKTLYQIYGDQKALAQLALELEKLKNQCAVENFCYYHFGITLNVIYEELGKFSEASNLLVTLLASPFKREDKIYYDLVRMQHMLGDKVQEKKYYDLLNAGSPNSPYLKLAKQLF